MNIVNVPLQWQFFGSYIFIQYLLNALLGYIFTQTVSILITAAIMLIYNIVRRLSDKIPAEKAKISRDSKTIKNISDLFSLSQEVESKTVIFEITSQGLSVKK